MIKKFLKLNVVVQTKIPLRKWFFYVDKSMLQITYCYIDKLYNIYNIDLYTKDIYIYIYMYADRGRYVWDRFV